MTGVPDIGGERGFTLVELLVSMASFIVVLSAIMMIVQVAIHDQDRIADRVGANQRARPVMTRLIDELHSGCVAPRIAPVRVNSSNTSIIFWSGSGSAVSPTPNQHVVTLSGSTLTEQIFPSNGGTPPNWTFSGTASQTRQLLTNVSQDGGTPLFRYYAYTPAGALSTTPMTAPLDAAEAAATVQVTVTFRTSPSGGSADPEAPITLSDSALLRLEAASADTSVVNLPCA